MFMLPLAMLALTNAPQEPKTMSYLDNGAIRVGIDLTIGGAITWVSKSGSDVNLINSADWGRQIQMSHYSGPNPFKPNGKQPQKVWEGLGWNPIQSGDCFGNRSKVLDHRNDGKELYVKCIPMQWPLNNEPGECTFECWIKLKGNTALVRSRMVNNRSDKTQYGGRGQELPAIYTNGPWYRLMTYDGAEPFTNGKLREFAPQFPWVGWQATENWAALVDESNNGIGIYEPGVYHMIGGFAGKPGKGGPKDGPTGYIAPLHDEILDWNIDTDYRYTLIVGSLDEIRKMVYDLAPKPTPPSYVFEEDRQHWHYANATDTGWPIRGELTVKLDGSDPQLIGPFGFWLAKDAPKLTIRAAYQGVSGKAVLFWSRADAEGFDEKRSVEFDVEADGQYHTYVLNLATSPEYRGAITRLRLDPSPGGKPGASIRVKSIGFGRAGGAR